MAGAPLQQGRRAAPVAVGLLEAIGQLGERQLFVGGWATEQPEAGSTVMVITKHGAVEARWFADWSDRPDVGPGTGFAGLLELSAPTSADMLVAVQLSVHTALGVYEQRQLLDNRQSSARLRESVKASHHTAQDPLRDAASRYDGSDSVATSELPIRLGIDDCVDLGAGTILVNGWLFDPESLVRQVELTAGGFTQPISDTWIVRRRADVPASVTADPRFAIYAGTGDHCGFTAIVTGAASRDDAHLTLTTRSGPLHAPLAPRSGNARVLLSGVLAGIDPDLPSSLDVADRIVAPVLAQLQPTRPEMVRSSQDDFDRTAPLSIVIGCSGDTDDVPALLATLAADPVAHATPILIAAPAAELAACQGDILRRAEFFGLNVCLVQGDGIADHVDALVLGALASEAEQVCLLACDIVPDAPDWLGRLIAARGQSASVVVPNQFDHAGFGPQASQRERSRLCGGGDCCLAPRQDVIEAYDRLDVYLNRASKAHALVAALEASVGRLNAAGVDMLNASAANPAASLLLRADRAATAIRAAGRTR